MQFKKKKISKEFFFNIDVQLTDHLGVLSSKHLTGNCCLIHLTSMTYFRWTIASFWSCITRVRIGTVVIHVTYQNPFYKSSSKRKISSFFGGGAE